MTLIVPLALASLASGGSVSPNVLLINEIRIDQPGADNDEFFELLSFPGNASLDGYSYLVLGDGAGGSGTIESVTDLSGQVTAASGLFLANEATFSIANPGFETSLNFENSDNVTHLVVLGFTGANGDDLDTNDDGILDVTPWTSVADAISLVENTDVPASGEFFYGSALGGLDVGPDGSFVPGHVLRCLTTLTDVRIGNFGAGETETPGDFNSNCVATTGTFCEPAAANSVSASGGRIELTGTGSIQLNDSTLLATSVPDTFGVFVQSDTLVPSAPASIGGNLCLNGNTQRMNRIIAGFGNQAVLPLDFTDGANVESGVSAGETYYYQFFHRDTVFTGGGNYTNGVSVTWAP